MIGGLSTGASSGNGGAMHVMMSGGGITANGSAASNGLATPSGIVRLSSPGATRQTSADGLGLYGPGTGSAVAMAQKLRQAADENMDPKNSNAQNPMNDVMLMLLIAQAKGFLSSARSSV